MSVADQMYDQLRGRILSGELPQGSRVVEAQLAKTMGTSRAPVREAVSRLLEAGLLEGRAHHGSTVIIMTAEKVRQLYHVRVAVETMAIREVIAHGRHRDLRALKAQVRAMQARARANDPPGLVMAEMRFHEVLWSLAGNPYIDRVAGLLADHMRLALAVDNAAYADLAEVAREHEPLIEAIESGDADRAAQVLTEHIMQSLDALARAQPDLANAG